MGLKGLAIIAVLLAVMQVPAAAYQAGANGVAPSAAPQSLASTAPASGADVQQHISVANPGPQALPWSLHEQIAWAANLILVIMGYAGIMLALQTLKKIERQTGYTESAAEAAAS